MQQRPTRSRSSVPEILAVPGFAVMGATARAFAALGVALAALAGAGTASAVDAFPPRKPGLWEINVQADGRPPHVARHCIDEKSDKLMQEQGMGLAAQSCSKREMKRDGDRFVTDAVCRFGTTNITTHSVMTGDFNAAVHTESDSRYDPPMMGKSSGRITIDAKWAGACPANWKAGDMEMTAGGPRINVNDVMQGVGKSAK